MSSAITARVRIVTAGLLVVVLWASAFPAIRAAAPALGPLGLALVRTVCVSPPDATFRSSPPAA